MPSTISNNSLYVNYNSTNGLYNLWNHQNAEILAGGDPNSGRTEAEVNTILAGHGLRVQHGQLVSVDGFTVHGQDAAPAISGASVVLPAVGADSAPASVVVPRLHWMQAYDATSMGALMWLELMTLALSAMHDVQDANDIKRALQASKIEAKDQELSARQKEIDAERREADFNLKCAICMAVVSTALSMAGAGAGSGMLGAGLSAAGSAVNTVGQAIVTQKNLEGARGEMYRQQLEKMRWAKLGEMYQMDIDAAQNNYDQAKELMKLALRILSEHYERQTQIVQALTR